MKAKISSNNIPKPKIGKKAKENDIPVIKDIKKNKNVQSATKNVAKENNGKAKTVKTLKAKISEIEITKPIIVKKAKEQEHVVQKLKNAKTVQLVNKNAAKEKNKQNPGKQNKTDNIPKPPLKRKAVEETAVKVDEQKKEIVKPAVPKKNILKAKEAIKKLDEVAREKKNQLFDDEMKIVLQFDCIKIPSCPPRVLRLNLPHWLVTETSDICLFVSDLRKGKKIDHEPTVQHYEDLLRSKGIKNIKTIMPMRQVKVEYSQSELKRRLLTQYEFFLADGKISKMLSNKLGKKFFIKNQLPIPINITKDDLKEEIDRALHKTPLPIHGNGTTFTVRVANMQHTDEQVVENVQAILSQVAEEFPGGWNNIRSVHLKSSLSMAIPIYATLKSKNDVDNIVIKSPYATDEIIEGEIDTVTNGIVKVYPDGKVEVIRSNKKDSDESDDDDSSDDEESNSKNIPNKKAKLETKTSKQNADKQKPSDELSNEQNADEDQYKNKAFQQNGYASDEQSENESPDDEGDDDNCSEKDDEMDSNDDSGDDDDDDDSDDDDEEEDDSDDDGVEEESDGDDDDDEEEEDEENE